MPTVYLTYEPGDLMLAGAIERYLLLSATVTVIDAHRADAIGRSPSLLDVLRSCSTVLLVGAEATICASRRLSFELGVALGRRMTIDWVLPIEDRPADHLLKSDLVTCHFIDFRAALKLDEAIAGQLAKSMWLAPKQLSLVGTTGRIAVMPQY